MFALGLPLTLETVQPALAAHVYYQNGKYGQQCQAERSQQDFLSNPAPRLF
jgi:hypothetical protein